MKIYVTFGQQHVHRVNGKTFDCDCVAMIEAEDEAAGRKIAFELFGPKFCFTYPENKFNFDHMIYFNRGIIPVG